MKIYFLILFFLSSFTVFSDVGHGYRFFLELVSKESDTITGYFYHYTYEDYNKYEHFDKGFKNFIKKDSINIYSFISTVSIGDAPVDFTSLDFKSTISINDFGRISIKECLEFQIDDRLKELTPPEFNLLQNFPPHIETIYNEKVAENCVYILLSWKNKPDLFYDKTEINDKLELFSEDIFNNQYIFYDYLKTKKLQLLEKQTLLIHLCTPL